MLACCRRRHLTYRRSPVYRNWHRNRDGQAAMLPRPWLVPFASLASFPLPLSASCGPQSCHDGSRLPVCLCISGAPAAHTFLFFSLFLKHTHIHTISMDNLVMLPCLALVVCGLPARVSLDPIPSLHVLDCHNTRVVTKLCGSGPTARETDGSMRRLRAQLGEPGDRTSCHETSTDWRARLSSSSFYYYFILIFLNFSCIYIYIHI